MSPTAEQTRRAVELLLDGAVPERAAELRQIWGRLQPEFQFLEDDGPAGAFVLDAGLYRFVRFNHRVMRLFWLGAFIAWEGYSAVHQQLMPHTGNPFERFALLIETFDAILKAQQSDSVPMPEGIPEPGVFPDCPDTRAPAELAVFATGWAMLHEVKHIQNQQDNTSAGAFSPPEEVRAEEFRCDEFATDFILTQAGAYAAANGVSENRVVLKRQLGIYFALFTSALLLRDRWDETDTHPALKDRIDAVRGRMGNQNIMLADAVAQVAFGALRTLHPKAPLPIP